MPIFLWHLKQLLCGEASISNIFIPTEMNTKTEESSQNLLSFFFTYFLLTLALVTSHSRGNTGIHQGYVENTVRTLPDMENSTGWNKEIIVCIFLKKGSRSSPMARIENLMLFFTLTEHGQFIKVQVRLGQDKK